MSTMGVVLIWVNKRILIKSVFLLALGVRQGDYVMFRANTGTRFRVGGLNIV